MSKAGQNSNDAALSQSVDGAGAVSLRGRRRTEGRRTVLRSTPRRLRKHHPLQRLAPSTHRFTWRLSMTRVSSNRSGHHLPSSVVKSLYRRRRSSRDEQDEREGLYFTWLPYLPSLATQMPLMTAATTPVKSITFRDHVLRLQFHHAQCAARDFTPAPSSAVFPTSREVDVSEAVIGHR